MVEPCVETVRRPYRNENKQIVGYRHHLAMISVVGGGITLPFDVEPYGPKDSEYAAGQRLLRRAVPALGARFADYAVVDAGFATNTFLHVCDELGLPVVARLKDNLPELSAAVEKRFSAQRPHRVLKSGLVHQFLETQGRQPGFIPHGQGPLGNRESGFQRLQDLPGAGAYLSSPPPQPAPLLAAHPIGARHQPTLSPPLSPSRRTSGDERMPSGSPPLARSRPPSPAPIQLSVSSAVESVFEIPAAVRLTRKSLTRKWNRSQSLHRSLANPVCNGCVLASTRPASETAVRQDSP